MVTALSTVLCLVLLLSTQTQAFTVHTTGSINTFKSAGVSRPSLLPSKPDVHPTRSLALGMVADSDDDGYTFNPSNIKYGVAWAALLGFTVFVAPGEFQSDYDNGIFQAILENPVKPALNELFYMVFNQFVIMSTTLACLTFPQASNKGGPPPLPFVVTAAFLGYFVYAPYLVLRGAPKDSVTLEELDFVTAQGLENKFFNAGTVTLSLFFLTQVPWGDFSSLASGYAEMASRSKLVSVASVDLTFLSLTAASLIPQDLKLRNPNADTTTANLIAASTMLLPVLGSAIYCLLRPSLDSGDAKE